MLRKCRNSYIICLTLCWAVIVRAGAVDAWSINARLGRAINLGNALEAAQEGAWGVTLREEYFQLIRDGGFDGVRIPIKWSAHAASTAPYTIDPTFLARIDWAVNNALSRGLIAIIDFHHYDEIMDSPGRQHQERFVAIWSQIAEHYKDYPDELLFELLNEPHGQLTSEVWNGLIAQTVAIIRQTNPQRNIIVGAVGWNSRSELVKTLSLPAADRHIIATFHHYSPFEFTHQGAEWVDGSDAWLGTTWLGTEQQKAEITAGFDSAYKWSLANDRPVFMGEFGAYSKADMQSRLLWTAFCAREAEQRRFSWGYWEFCSGFGAYDDKKGKWNALHRALVPDAAVENQVRNGEFDFGTDHWQVSTAGKASVSLTIANAGLSGPNSLAVLIHDGGSAETSVTVSQQNIVLEYRKPYRISVTAKADSPRTVQTRLQHRQGAMYWQQTQLLTTGPQKFTYLFDSPTSNSETVLCFLLGGNSADVWLDDVVVKEAWDCNRMLGTGLRLLADLSGPSDVPDCYVNAYDLAAIAQSWLTNDSYADIAGADGPGDGIVNALDYSRLAELWLQCNNLLDVRCDADGQ